MASLYSFSRRRLCLPGTNISFKRSPLSSQTRTFTAFALLALLLTFYYLYHFNTFTPIAPYNEPEPYSKLDPYSEPELKHESEPTVHQIPALMAAGQEKWSSMLSKQSKTLTEAVVEYRRRYNLEPPDGFDDWFHYAQSHNVTLIDEYDELMNSLAPFRALGAEEVRRRTDVLNRGGVDINTLRISANGVEYSMRKEHEQGARKERTEGLIAMLQPVQEYLAKRKWETFVVAINELAESRVLGGDWETDALDPEKEEKLIRYKLVNAVWESHAFGEGSLIKSVMKACGPDSVFTKANPTFKVEKLETGQKEKGEERVGESAPVERSKFESLDWLEDIDICNHPELTQVRTAPSSLTF